MDEQIEHTAEHWQKAAWSARCDCRNNHNSASGRCNSRDVTDPTRFVGDEFAVCEGCRLHCPVGSGFRLRSNTN